MKKHLTKNIGITFVSALMLAGHVNALDQAAAAADLAEIAVISVQSKAKLAGAALGGDVNAIGESGKRSDAADAAMSQGQKAYSEMERALKGGNNDLAQSAAEGLQASKRNALGALNGVFPASRSTQSSHKKFSKSQKHTGGGPGRAHSPPNIYDKSWNTKGMSAFYQSLWGTFWSSGVTSGGRGDKDATRE